MSGEANERILRQSSIDVDRLFLPFSIKNFQTVFYIDKITTKRGAAPLITVQSFIR